MAAGSGWRLLPDAPSPPCSLPRPARPAPHARADVSHYFDSDPTKLVAGLRGDGKTPAAFIADTTTANAQVGGRWAVGGLASGW